MSYGDHLLTYVVTGGGGGGGWKKQNFVPITGYRTFEHDLKKKYLRLRGITRAHSLAVFRKFRNLLRCNC